MTNNQTMRFSGIGTADIDSFDRFLVTLFRLNLISSKTNQESWLQAYKRFEITYNERKH